MFEEEGQKSTRPLRKLGGAASKDSAVCRWHAGVDPAKIDISHVRVVFRVRGRHFARNQALSNALVFHLLAAS